MSSNLVTKTSIGATILIIALGSGLGFRQLSEISDLQQQVDANDPQTDNSPPPRRRILSSSNNSIADITTGLVELEPYGKEDPDLDKPYLDAQFKIEIASLSSVQSEEIVRQLLMSEKELSKSEIRVVRYSLTSLADEQPQATLDLIKLALEHPAFPNPSSFRKSATAALINLGREELDSVNNWFNSDSKISSVERFKVINGIFALRALGGFEEPFALVNSKMQGRNDIAAAIYGIQDSLTLESAEDYLSAVRKSELSPELKRQALKAFAIREFAPDFETTASWIESQNLEYQEIRGILNGLCDIMKPDRLPKWITWVAEDSVKRDRFSGNYESAMSHLLATMVKVDFVEVGQLINSLPENSRAKEYARSEYAKHMSSVNPKVAIEWFNTLPPGKEKTKTGRELYQKYHLMNPTMAEEFAIKNKLYVE